MKKKFILALALLVAFTLWTVALCYVDVQAIAPGILVWVLLP